MKVIIVIDMPDDLDTPLYDIKTEITLSSKGITDSSLYLKYDNAKLKPLPQKIDANDWHRMFSGTYKEREAKGYGYNACISEILGEEDESNTDN